MTRISKNTLNKLSLSLWMSIILLLPLLIKSYHPHTDITCQEKNISHFHSLPETCLICDFNFSIFSESSFDAKIEQQEYAELFLEPFNSSINLHKGKYSFLLRAPPAFTN